MFGSTESMPLSTVSNKKSVLALENTLQQSITNLKELVLEFEQLQQESDEYKAQVSILKGKCESKICIGSEALKKVIELKDNIIQSVASALTRLNETKDMKIIDEAFKILCGETITLTPPKESADLKLKTPEKEVSPSYTEAINDESVSEIEATPSGRKSPIIGSRKARNAAASDHREKKKCPTNWSTPETKAVKLTFPTTLTPQGRTGKGRMKQMRFTTVRQNSRVDITSSPEFCSPRNSKDSINGIQLNIKRESLDDEDTIEPSPTSLTSNFSSIYKSAMRSSPLKLNKNSPNKITKGSPSKLSLTKKPFSNISKLQIKIENTKYNAENEENMLEDSDLKHDLGDSGFKIKMEDSVNLLRPVPRFPEKSPSKRQDPNETECNIDSSMSLLQHVNKLEKVSTHNGLMSSPTKRPLAENINCTNLQTQCDTQASVSLLNPALEGILKKDLERLEAKGEKERVEVFFKEPTVRKKAEKRALPGWSCDECKNFYAELYKNDPEMLEKKMDECSKHRGRTNPARPKTPPGFWNPRWDVPADTEEFNRRNNAT